MESSQVQVSAGEFGGSESGWTSHIGSLHHSETYNEDNQSLDTQEYDNIHGYDDSGNGGDGGIADDEESDDSMASDAASGLSHLQFLYRKSEGSPVTDCLKHAEDNCEKNLKEKRGGKQVKKTRNETKVEEEEEKEEELLLKAVSAGSRV